ncbi:hypothetical protein ACHAW5_005943 [Stephanodiscus triporus]|uniref:Uncharacterized protein n=1 Tax=Stephanodiscus triporus TaxID=2934178 RepID=A0ABD3NE85_9STRA
MAAELYWPGSLIVLAFSPLGGVILLLLLQHGGGIIVARIGHYERPALELVPHAAPGRRRPHHRGPWIGGSMCGGQPPPPPPPPSGE